MSKGEWARFVWVVTPKRVRYMARDWWVAVPLAVLTGTYMDRSVGPREASRPAAAGGPRLLAGRPLAAPAGCGGPRLPGRCPDVPPEPRAAAVGAGEGPCLVANLAGPGADDDDGWIREMQQLSETRRQVDAQATAELLVDGARVAQVFFADLAGAHETDLVQSHGDQLPGGFRDSAAFVWWLPDLLRRPAEARSAAHMEALDDVRTYVSKELPMFVWPTAQGMETQYKLLIEHWANLFRSDTDVARVLREWLSGFATKTKVGLQAFLREPQHHNGHAFPWRLWWRMSHTNEVSAGVKKEFVPRGTEAAFMLFHYTGMIGVSEAHAESIGSILKRFGKTLSTPRVVEATILRAAGVVGEGGDDGFIQACWGKFFGSSKPGAWNFNFKGENRRRRLHPEAGGSKTLAHGVRAAAHRKFTDRELRLLQEAQTGKRHKLTFAWRAQLARLRQGEVG